MKKKSILELKNKYSFIRKSIILLFLLFISNIFFVNPIFSSNIIKEDSLKGTEQAVPFALKYNDLIVTGDSYAGKFCQYEYDRDLTLYPFACAGQTLSQNSQVMEDAFKFDKKIVLVSIGVNDHFQQTPPYRFEASLRNLINISVLNNKIVFFHSYVPYFTNDIDTKRYSIEIYDIILQNLSNEFKNVYYINLHDLPLKSYILKDNIHYNKEFNDILYNRVVNIIKDFDFAKY